MGLLFGGRSGEHDVSVMSAVGILKGLEGRYDVVPIGITRSGQFLPGTEPQNALQAGGVEKGGTGAGLKPLEVGPAVGRIDVIIPALHGPLGEDGTVQGLLDLAGIPYVGSGVLGSAVSMDKAVMKHLLAASGLPVGPWLLLTEAAWHGDPSLGARRVEALGWPVFVKPANMGSSVGISKVASKTDLEAAVLLAFSYDERVVVERGIPGRELECAVLGNDAPEASVVGEILPHGAFYDYQAKYGEDGADLVIPADLPPEVSKRVRDLSLGAFQAVDARGLARVDFFLADQTLYLNEINTFPGFTPYSMYPRLWEATGVSYPQLLDRLIQLALERHRGRQRKWEAMGRTDKDT